MHDMPGAGTVSHPELTYWEDKQLACFNVLLVFLELGSILDFERDLIQRAISQRSPPIAVVVGQADRPVAKLTRRGVSLADATARVREEAVAALRRDVRLHEGEPLPQVFMISQRKWRDKVCEFDESEMVAYLLRQAAQADLPPNQINLVLRAVGMPPIVDGSSPAQQRPADKREATSVSRGMLVIVRRSAVRKWHLLAIHQ